MNFSGKYKVTEVRERANGGKSRYVVLSPQDHLSGRTADGCIELLVVDELLVLEFAINSLHAVTVSPVVSAVRAAVPAGPIQPGDTVGGFVVEDENRHADTERTRARHDIDADLTRRNRG